MATISELLALARANAALRASRTANQTSQAIPTARSAGAAAQAQNPETNNNNLFSPELNLNLAPAAPLANIANTATQNFNPEQLQAIELALEGKSFCLIGAAGTGKTTVTQEIIKRLQTSSHVFTFTESTKHLVKDTVSIVITGYTNKAVNNIKKKLSEKLQNHCITMHKLVEFGPVYFEKLNEQTGNIATTMRFEPARNSANPLPHVSTIIFEESSMIGTDLYAQIIDALPHPHQTQMIFLGDLNQLPPVFGPSILGFKLTELPLVELTHVYRQALASPIISLATDIRLGKLSTKFAGGSNEITDCGADGKLTVRTWKKRTDTGALTPILPQIIIKMISENLYNPYNPAHMMLCPFNVGFGTVEINKAIASYIDKKDNRTVYEIIARYTKSYFAVGDRVFVDRHEAVITKIESTVGYVGKLPCLESKTLNRDGTDSANPINTSNLTADEILNQIPDSSDDDDAKNLASHTITVYIPDLETERKLSTAGEINSTLLGYCLTVHKSQGSEWEHVVVMFHNSHNTMLSRELVYTAVTRAKHSLVIMCEADSGPYKNSLVAASQRPRIPGTSLKDKIEYFRGKAKEYIN